MDCGCYWVSPNEYERSIGVGGDVLRQCDDHKAGDGEPYAGSEPMTPAEMEAFLLRLRAAGFEAWEIGPATEKGER